MKYSINKLLVSIVIFGLIAAGSSFISSARADELIESIPEERLEISEIEGSKTLAEILAKAQTDKREAVVIVLADWCYWSGKMISDVLSEPQVNQLLDNHFVYGIIDAGHEREMIKQYQIPGYPSILLLTATGKVKAELYGFQTANDFSQWLAQQAGIETVETVETVETQEADEADESTE